MTKLIWADPLAVPSEVGRNVGETIAEKLAEHGCQPQAKTSNWCKTCLNIAWFTCDHCGGVLLTIYSRHGTCPDCPEETAA